MICCHNRWSTWLIFFAGGGVSTKSSPGPIPAAFSSQLAYRATMKGVPAQFQRKVQKKLVFRGRLMRRTIARYLIVALIQCLRMTSIQVWAQQKGRCTKTKFEGETYLKNNLTRCLWAAIDVLLSCAMASTQCRFSTMQIFWFFPRPL